MRVGSLLLALGSMAALGGDDPKAGVPSGTSRALIVVGLPGDSEHEALFRATADRWKDWLTGPLGFAPAEVRVLSGPSATREAIAGEAESIRSRSKAEDRAWVFVLGHANLDDSGHAFLHIPGPDLRDDEFAALFKDWGANEQVFWMTTAASGAFLPPLSKPGRVAIAATAPTGEGNETEFPHALADVVRRPAAKLDADKDGKVSLRELFDATVIETEARFAADNRAPSEHARLDDDGDGVGTETVKPGEPAKSKDGAVASKIFVATGEPKSPDDRSDHGPRPAVPPAR